MFRPSGKVGEVTISGQQVACYFNLNTISEFELVSGRHFLAAIADIWDAKSKASAQQGDQAMLELLRVVRLRDIHALLHSAIQKYDSAGEVTYRFSFSQLGGKLDLAGLAKVMPILWAGIGDFSPREDELPPSVKAAVKANEGNANPTQPPPSTANDGGVPSVPSDSDVLDSLSKSSAAVASEPSTSGGESTS